MIVPLKGAIAQRKFERYFLPAICLTALLPGLVRTVQYTVDYEGGDCGKSYTVGNLDIFYLIANPRPDLETGRDACFNLFIGKDKLKLKFYIKAVQIPSCGGATINVFDGDVRMNLDPSWRYGCHSGQKEVHTTLSSELIIRLDKPVSDSTNSYKFEIYVTNEKGPYIDLKEPTMDGGISGGVIAGIAIGVALVIIVIIVIIVIVAYRWMKKKEKEHKPYKTQDVFSTTSGQGSSVRFQAGTSGSKRGTSMKSGRSANSYNNHGYEASVNSSVTEKRRSQQITSDAKKYIADDHRRHLQKEEQNRNKHAGRKYHDEPDGGGNKGQERNISRRDVPDGGSSLHKSKQDHENSKPSKESHVRNRNDKQKSRNENLAADLDDQTSKHSNSKSKSNIDTSYSDEDEIIRNRSLQSSSHHKNQHTDNQRHHSQSHQSSSNNKKGRDDYRTKGGEHRAKDGHYDYDSDHKGKGGRHGTTRAGRSDYESDHRSSHHGYDSDLGNRKSLRSRVIDQKGRYTDYETDDGNRQSLRRSRDSRRGYDSDDGNRQSMRKSRGYESDGGNRQSMRRSRGYESDGGNRQSMRRSRGYESDDGKRQSLRRSRGNDNKRTHDSDRGNRQSLRRNTDRRDYESDEGNRRLSRKNRSERDRRRGYSNERRSRSTRNNRDEDWDSSELDYRSDRSNHRDRYHSEDELRRSGQDRKRNSQRNRSRSNSYRESSRR